MNNHELLYPDETIEYYFSGAFAGVVAEELQRRAADSPFDDVIDFGDTLPQRVIEGAQIVPELLGVANEDERSAIARAAIFGWQIAGVIYGESSVGMHLPEELLQAIEEGRSITPEELVSLRERIYWDTGAYLALNGGGGAAC